MTDLNDVLCRWQGVAQEVSADSESVWVPCVSVMDVLELTRRHGSRPSHSFFCVTYTRYLHMMFTWRTYALARAPIRR